MSIPTTLAGTAGKWEGVYKLWFDAGAPVTECATTAEIATAAAGRFLALRYNWAHEGKAVEGFLMLGDDPAAKSCVATWVDSFHNSDRMMPCVGALAGDGPVSVRGDYPPEYPGWAWRTELSHPGADSLVMRMFNIMPDGIEMLAVEAMYRRSH